jgi:hypothetical protein
MMKRIVLRFPALSSRLCSLGQILGTGPVLEVKDDMIVVQKGNDKWEISRDKATKVTGDLKVGSKVTIQYQMSAQEIEVKDAPKKEAPAKAPAKKYDALFAQNIGALCFIGAAFRLERMKVIGTCPDMSRCFAISAGSVCSAQECRQRLLSGLLFCGRFPCGVSLSIPTGSDLAGRQCGLSAMPAPPVSC